MLYSPDDKQGPYFYLNTENKNDIKLVYIDLPWFNRIVFYKREMLSELRIKLTFKDIKLTGNT